MNAFRKDELVWVYELGQSARATGKHATDWTDYADGHDDWDAGMTAEWRRGFWDAEDGTYNPIDED